MKFRHFFISITLWLIATSTSAQKPNILVIMTDDQTVETISAFGAKNVKTPNIDALVNRGCSFTNAYNMGGLG